MAHCCELDPVLIPLELGVHACPPTMDPEFIPLSWCLPLGILSSYNLIVSCLHTVGFMSVYEDLGFISLNGCLPLRNSVILSDGCLPLGFCRFSVGFISASGDPVFIPLG